MQIKATHVPVVRQWCQSLGVLSAVSISRQESEMKLAAYVPLLVDRFPDAAFTQASLEHCARNAVKGFPTYGELAAWLSDWWRERRPPVPAITQATPTEQLSRRDDELSREWDDPAGIQRRILEAGDDTQLVSYLAAAVRKFAPQHVDLLPQAVVAKSLAAEAAAIEDAPQPPSRPKAHHLFGEQLLAVYEAQGLGGCHRAQMLRDQIRRKPPRTVENLEHAD